MDVCTEIATRLMLNGAKDGRTNIASSPLSMNILLNMLTVGTKGRTQKQLLDALKLETVDDINGMSSNMMAMMNIPIVRRADTRKYGGWYKEGPTLSLVNGVWGDRQLTFKPLYKELVTSIYKADIRTFDFFNKPDEVVKEVNSWAKKETKGLIQDLLHHIPRDTNLILANALYFRGTWFQPFEKLSTREENFYLLNGETAKVPFMVTLESQYCRFFDDFKLLKLPYNIGKDETREYSMYIFLPDERNGLENLLQKINSNPLLLHEKCARREELSKTLVPKFKFQYEFKLSEMMMGMGIDLPFRDVGEMDMIETIVEEDMDRGYVVEIIQKSYVEVKEGGTEAAAVTYGHMVGENPWYMPPPPPEEFVADHPFFFLIKEDISDSIIFSGVVVNPLMP